MLFLLNELHGGYIQSNQLYEAACRGSDGFLKKARVMDTEALTVGYYDWDFVHDHIKEFASYDNAFESIQSYLSANDGVHVGKMVHFHTIWGRFQGHEA